MTPAAGRKAFQTKIAGQLGLLALLGAAALVVAPAAPGTPTSGVVAKGGYYKMASDKITFNVNGFVKVDCYDVEIVSNSVGIASTTITANGGSGGASHVKFASCSKGATDVTVDTYGSWAVSIKERTAVGPPESWALEIKVDKAVLTIPDETCVVTLDNPQKATGTFTDGNPPQSPNTAMAFTSAVSWTGVGCFLNQGTAAVEGIFTVTANTQQTFKGTDLEVDAM